MLRIENARPIVASSRAEHRARRHASEGPEGDTRLDAGGKNGRTEEDRDEDGEEESRRRGLVEDESTRRDPRASRGRPPPLAEARAARDAPAAGGLAQPDGGR